METKSVQWNWKSLENAWKLKDSCAFSRIETIDFLQQHFFKVHGSKLIYNEAWRVAMTQNKFIWKRIDLVPKAGINAPTLSALSFPALFMTKKGRKSQTLPGISKSIFHHSNIFLRVLPNRNSWLLQEEDRNLSFFGTCQLHFVHFGFIRGPSAFYKMTDDILRGPRKWSLIFAALLLHRNAIETNGKFLESYENSVRAWIECRNEQLLRFLESNCLTRSHIRFEGYCSRCNKSSYQKEQNPDPEPILTEELSKMPLYYRRFTRDFFSQYLPYFRQVHEKSVKIVNAGQTGYAFDVLQDGTTSPPVLIFSNFESLHFVQLNASSLKDSSLLVKRKENGQVHPVQFSTGTINSLNRWFSACETVV